MQRALVAVLLALIGLFGVAAEQSPAQSTTISATVSATIGTAPAAEPAAWLPGPAAAAINAGSHAHDAVSLLCLCALVMVGVLLVTRRGTPPHPSVRRDRTAAPVSTLLCGVFPTTSTDPLSWGVCRR